MDDSRLYKQEDDSQQELPRSRIVLWAIIGLVILAGLALYFRYEHFVRPVL